ncbi:hypothetical protein [Streptomyces sp. NPDC086023]|uniref:hypothetical protein n=1 Tax=Streptomyces sp. NPDC086023 TaxID=3365746 RepID=UPI0037D3865B
MGPIRSGTVRPTRHPALGATDTDARTQVVNRYVYGVLGTVLGLGPELADPSGGPAGGSRRGAVRN